MRFKTGLESSKTVRWADMQRKRGPIIRRRYTKSSRGKRTAASVEIVKRCCRISCSSSGAASSSAQPNHYRRMLRVSLKPVWFLNDFVHFAVGNEMMRTLVHRILVHQHETQPQKNISWSVQRHVPSNVKLARNVLHISSSKAALTLLVVPHKDNPAYKTINCSNPKCFPRRPTLSGVSPEKGQLIRSRADACIDDRTAFKNFGG